MCEKLMVIEIYDYFERRGGFVVHAILSSIEGVAKDSGAGVGVFVGARRSN